MKVDLHIDSKLDVERADFWLRQMTTRMATIIAQLNQERETLWCYQDDEVKPVAYRDIIVLRTVGSQIQITTADNRYYYRARMAKLAAQLPAQFIESARGTMINYQKIDHLELLGNGKIDVLMVNQERVQMARRKIKNLKEKLGL